ncbi:conserved hypothetical protein [Mesotoga infera]|nr:conserved hypothetical protein [Mesotoga infera]
MNYIELINNFWIQHRRFHFNEKEISMFFFLLDRANELFWPESFSMPCSVFRKEFGWTRNQVRWARSKLIETGIISYSSGDTGRSGEYSFSGTFLRASSTQCVSNPCALSAHGDELIETSSELEERSSEMCNGEDSTRKSCADHAQLSRESRTRTLYINKTKQDKTKLKNILSPYGETKVSLSQSTGEGVKNEEILQGMEPVSGISEKGNADRGEFDRGEFPPGELSVSSSGIESNAKEEPRNGEGGPPEEVPAEGCLVVPLFEMNDQEAKQSEEGQEDFSYLESCSRYERDVMETWEAIIGPFEREWIPLLREALKKCYPSQIKNAIIAIDRSKHEVLEEIGFEYLMQPLLRGAFGRRVKKNGRKDWSDSESFRDPIEKFKNPARERPKTLEELLKYTV